MKILNVLTPKRRLGNIGERYAQKHLKKNGYKILEKNYVAIDTEIDIIAENKEAIAFIEVKTRTEGSQSLYEPRPSSSITPEKQRKIISAAKYYLATKDVKKHVRLDVIEVYVTDKQKKSRIVHMENAFNLNTAYRKAYSR